MIMKWFICFSPVVNMWNMTKCSVNEIKELGGHVNHVIYSTLMVWHAHVPKPIKKVEWFGKFHGIIISNFD